MKSWHAFVSCALVMVVGCSLPYWFIPTEFALRVATFTVLYAAAGVCWNLIGGVGGQLSFGHSVYFGLGAYTTALLYLRLDVTPWLGMLAGGVLAMAVGALTTFPALRLRGVYFALTTFVIALLFQDLAMHFRDFTNGDVGLSLPFAGNDPANMQFVEPLVYYMLAVGMLALFILAFGLITNSRLGLFLRSVRDDEDAARASGVRVPAIKLAGLSISAFGTGMVGGLFFQFNQFIDPASAFGLLPATIIALVALAGGVGAMWGPVLGAVILVPLQQYLSASLSSAPAGLSQVAYGALVVAIVLIDRRGLLFAFDRTARRLGASRRRPFDGAHDDRTAAQRPDITDSDADRPEAEVR